MNKAFYSRLATINISNNKSIYIPYLLSGSLIVALFYILSSMTVMVADAGSQTMSAIIGLSTRICGILSVVFLFYINSFIMKRRKKEFGLYSILGMEKRHICIVMFWEVLITSVVCILGGIGGGVLFGQLCFLVLLNMIGIPAALSFQIPLHSVTLTLILFGIVFLAVLVFDIIAIIRADPIALLHSSKEGEREPRANWLVALVGVAALGSGYWLSWSAQTVGEALSIFFIAVLLVMIGTYCLFIAGSIVILKLLRKNKSFYYRPNNFISVSGMIYRMKQNATGLANICILATCVLVTLSSTICLFLGQDDIVRKRFYRQILISGHASEQTAQQMQSTAQTHAQQYGLQVENPVGCYVFTIPGLRTDDAFSPHGFYNSETYAVKIITLEDYNRIAGATETLQEHQVLAYLKGKALQQNSLTIAGVNYEVKLLIPEPVFLDRSTMANQLTLVVANSAELNQIKDAVNNSAAGSFNYKIGYTYQFDVSGDQSTIADYYASMRDTFNQAIPNLTMVDNIDYARRDFYHVYGSLLFVGIFFVALFLIATVLIIYYKQVTEGFDDRERFQIMQKVGMSDKEVKNTIQKQVLMVFFLPLGVAVLHIAVAFKVLVILLSAFQMTNVTLFFWCTLGVVFFFAVLYYIVYQLTARTYYHILQREG